MPLAPSICSIASAGTTRRLVRSVGELLELLADEVGGLLADVDSVIADSLQAA